MGVDWATTHVLEVSFFICADTSFLLFSTP
jgi:hypothetical protein